MSTETETQERPEEDQENPPGPQNPPSPTNKNEGGQNRPSPLSRLDPRERMRKKLDPRERMKEARKQLLPKTALKQAAKTAVKAAASNPIVWVIVAVVLIILFLIIIIIGTPDPNAIPLVINKTGPATANNGDQLDYQIVVSYAGNAESITITDIIPSGTEYVGSNPPASFDPATQTATWNLKDFVASPGATLSNVNTTLNLQLRATRDNTQIVNIARGAVVPATETNPGGGGGPISDGFVPAAPSSNNCGKWDFSRYPEKNPLGNYGDPQCNFSKDNLYALLKSTEPNPEFVNIWFNVVVPKESNFRPNAFAPPVGIQCSLDCAGAWGLYQMGSSKPSGQPPPAPGKNGPLDRGDVNWETQTSMAIRYNRERIKCNFRYWSSARSVHGKYSC